MRALLISLLPFIATGSTPAQAKDLIYFFIDAHEPLEFRRVIADFASELLSHPELGYDNDVYLHIDGIKIHYPDMPIYQVSKGRDVNSFLAAVSEVAESQDYYEFWRSEAPDLVEETNPAATLGVISKNIISIENDQGAYEKKYFIQASNLNFHEPVNTSGLILGDGWITSPSSPMKEFVYGSQSRAFKDTKIFIALFQPEGVPLPWYEGRKAFFQKLYSAIGADIRSIKRTGNMPYGGGAVLVESYFNSIKSDHQAVGRSMPRATNLVQVIDPITNKAKTVQ